MKIFCKIYYVLAPFDLYYCFMASLSLLFLHYELHFKRRYILIPLLVRNFDLLFDQEILSVEPTDSYNDGI